MIIYTGRFQPIHNGHISLIKRLKEKYPNEILCIAVIKDIPLVAKTDFDITVDEVLSQDRNPFNTETTLSIIDKALKSEKIENTIVTLMPRASSTTWHIIKALFDCERIWVFTKNQTCPDDWEDKKATFYHSMGDKVVRIPIEKDIEGTTIRQAIANHDYDKLSTLVPKEVLDYLIKYGSK